MNAKEKSNKVEHVFKKVKICFIEDSKIIVPNIKNQIV